MRLTGRAFAGRTPRGRGRPPVGWRVGRRMLAALLASGVSAAAPGCQPLAFSLARRPAFATPAAPPPAMPPLDADGPTPATASPPPRDPPPVAPAAAAPPPHPSADPTPADLPAWARLLEDVDRADPRYDWAALRRLKERYNFFYPVPRELRREFVTDRPDKTINPVTVDAGHVQVETDLVTATFDRRQPRRALAPGQVPRTGTGGFVGQQPYTPGDKDDYVFLLTNVRIGLTNNVDAHVFFRPLQHLSTPGGNGLPGVDAFGYGDMRVLFKENLWGNEGGPTAFALTQYLDIPTGRSDLSTGALEGGATGALLVRFPGKTYLGFETGLEWRKDIAENRYHVEVPASVSFAVALTKELSAKAEFASVFSAEPGARWVGVVSLAALYGFGDDLQLDVGINIGVTPAANDWNPFVGLAKRF